MCWKQILLVLILLPFLFPLNSLADDFKRSEETITPSPGWNIEQGIELPIGKTQWEIENEHLFPIIYPTDDPPPQPSINPAEWERMTGVLIRYPLGLPYNLIAEMSEDVTVVTIVSSETQVQQVLVSYENNGVNTANCEWLIAPSNSIWTRDYGPWFIFTGEDVQGISNHIYNRPSRPYDNMIPVRFGEAYNIPVYDLPLVHTGGNYMSDGMGISMSTDLVYDENPSMTQAQVDEYMNQWLGVEDYDVVDDILPFGIHHIDCWAKLLDPSRILAKRLDPPNSVLEENVEYWENKISSYGRPYEVLRIDCASNTPYTNALILNDKVLVPLFGNPLDQQAMDTWEAAMPGYEILGFTGSWVSDDAIHCRAMGITDRYMLRIVHIPLFDRENNGEDYPVTANVHPYSNEPLLPGMPQIFYSVDGNPWQTVEMSSLGDDEYLGYIPAQPDYSSIEYYIHAEDASGRRENHPFIGPGNPHRFIVAPDTIPPQIAFEPLTSTYSEIGPYILEAELYDINGISEANIYWSIDGAIYTPVPMINVNGNIWNGGIPGQPSGTMVYYYVEAVDNSVAGNVSQSDVYNFVVKQVFYSYDVESGTQNWTHSSPGGQWTDEWHISTEDSHSPSHAWKCGSNSGTNYGNNLDARLISPEIELMPQAELFFWHRMDAEISGSYPDSCYDGGIVEIMLEGASEWQQIFPVNGYNQYTRASSNSPFPNTACYSGHIEWTEEVFDLSSFSGVVQIRYRFGSDGSVGDEGWFIDDVIFAGLEDTITVPLEVTITPENPPIIIPGMGGTFEYSLDIANTGPAVVNFDGWISAILPTGGEYLVLLREGLSLPPAGSLSRDMIQNVPATAPAGTYDYTLFTGEYPTIIYASDGFQFEKAPWDGSVSAVDNWGIFGWDEQMALDALPMEYKLNQNYPNPFNASTTINYQLPQPSQVKLVIYNMMGQKVATLVNGSKTAGYHNVVWQGISDAGIPVASGIYLYRMEAISLTGNGSMRDFGKMLLLK